MRAMSRVAADLFGPEFRWEGVDAAGHLDHLILAEAAELNGLSDIGRQVLRFRERYLPVLAEELQRSPDEMRALPGVGFLLAELRRWRAAGAELSPAILTGNFADAVPLKLGAVGLDPGWFDFAIGCDHGERREDLVAVAWAMDEQRRGERLPADRVFVIGDTPRDVACAQAHGCVSVAVATGPFDAEALAACGADHVLTDLSDAAWWASRLNGSIRDPAAGDSAAD